MKKILVLALTLSTVFLMSACGSDSDSVKLGVIGPLTGPYSFYGLSVENGAKLAADEINAAGGVLGQDLEIIAYDSEGDPTKGVNAYNRLRDEDEIDALIGGTFSGVTGAIKELAVLDNMPVLTPTATNPTITLDAPSVFRACFVDSYQGEVLATFANESEAINATKAAILYNVDDAYSEGLAMAFKDEFETRGEVVELLTFGSTDVDYNTVLDKIAASEAEVVFLPGYANEVGAILTAADSKGIEIPFIGGDGWDGLEEDYADVAEGNYFGNHYAKSDESQVVVDFVANYEAAFGNSPSALAALAYDAVYVMVAAMEEAGSVDADLVIAALTGFEYLGAVTGDIKFDENGDVESKAVTIIQIVDGEHSVIEKVQVIVPE